MHFLIESCDFFWFFGRFHVVLKHILANVKEATSMHTGMPFARDRTAPCVLG